MKPLTFPRIGKRLAFGAGAVLLAVPLVVSTVVGTAQAHPGHLTAPAPPTKDRRRR